MKNAQNHLPTENPTKVFFLLVAGSAASLLLSVTTVGLLIRWFIQA